MEKDNLKLGSVQSFL